MEIVNVSMKVLYMVRIYLNTNLVKDIVDSWNFFVEKICACSYLARSQVALYII